MSSEHPSHEARASGPGGSTRFLFATFSLGHMANDWAPGAIWIIAPAMALDTGLSPSELGALFTIYAVGASLAYLPSGILADQVRDRGRLLSFTFWWVTIGFFAASFAPGFWSFAIALALAGLGDAAWHPIATGVLTGLWPERRGEALGVHAIGGSLATVLAPLSVGYLLAVVDWRDALRISVIPAAIMGIVFLAVVARRVPMAGGATVTRGDMRTFAGIWLGRTGLRLLAAIVSYHMAVTALMSMTPLFLQTVHGYSTAQAGTLFAAALLAGAVIQPWIGRVSDRIGRAPVLIVVATVGAVLAAGVAVVTAPIALVGLVIGAIGVLVGARAVVLALAVDIASQRQGTTLGFVFALMDGIGALGAILAGLVAEIDLGHAFTLAGGLSLLSVAMVMLMSLSRTAAAGNA